ncbi:aldose 1-epimerase family protein [Nocardioides jiangxiensis]|uniref:Aldose 1-epimerase family protein n=1 Tax=Nocardioides jiangxiensis TaxID=3064524 RepID=A0ABT9B5R2_9ACTN|nr:aldose 1-epimerase family protein [Nocardioides sp. WY-20]MDO7869639.1 aldose 1-epimerase family protein [Nocardioides sp. WY-20]
MLSPSGEQFEISAGGYRAVITESGAALRVLTHDGEDLVDGFAEDAMASMGRGQLLMPWPNRIEDGRYEFAGVQQQLALTEPKRSNASHGLARWAAWSVLEHTASSVALTYRLMAQTGYPWLLDLHVQYDVSADGLTVTQSATNLSDSPAPYASGAHPYLTVGAPLDTCELLLPAATRGLADPVRLLPTGRESVEGTDVDFQVWRPVKGTVFNDAFTDLRRGRDGRAEVVLRADRAVLLWVDEQHRWLQLYSGDDVAGHDRRSLAVEPMTANANAFRTGEDLVTIEPEDTFSAVWGIRAV